MVNWHSPRHGDVSPAPGVMCVLGTSCSFQGLDHLGEPSLHHLATPVPSCGLQEGERGPSSPHFQLHPGPAQGPVKWMMGQSGSAGFPSPSNTGSRCFRGATGHLQPWLGFLRLPPDDGINGGEQMPTQAGCAEHWHPEGRAPLSPHWLPTWTPGPHWEPGLTAPAEPALLLPHPTAGHHAQTQGSFSDNLFLAHGPSLPHSVELSP